MSLRSTLTAVITSALLFGAVPTFALAATCSITAMDTVAGLGTHMTIAGCSPLTSQRIDIDGPDGERTTLEATLDAQGNGTLNVPTKITEKAGTYRIIAGQTQATFAVLPDRADDARSSIVALTPMLPVPGNVTVRVVLRDRYDNPIAQRPLALMSSRASDTSEPRSAQTDAGGTATWTLSLKEAGTAVITPYDLISSRPIAISTVVTVGGSSLLTASLTGREQGGPLTASTTTFATGFCISWPQGGQTPTGSPKAASYVQPPAIPLHELFSLDIIAVSDTAACTKNAASNPAPLPVVRSYVGTVIVESSDADLRAELPKKGVDPSMPSAGLVEFRNFDQGIRSVSQSFLLASPGPQTITVYDKDNPMIRGEITLNDSRGTIQIQSPISGSRIRRAPTILVQGHAPSLVPLSVRIGTLTAQGTADTLGIYRIEAPLPPDRSELTIYVEAQGIAPATADIIIDDAPPVITTASIDPERGHTEQGASLTVLAEPGLSSVTATVNSVTTDLKESAEKPGTYIGTLQAPKKEGTYDITIRAVDTVDNDATLLLKWTVLPQTVPMVQGLEATEVDNGIRLSWADVPGIDIAEYRIYIARAEDPDNILYSLGTGKPVRSAIITDLPRGGSYRLSMTARTLDGQESAEKSASILVTVPGLTLESSLTPSGLMLRWTPITGVPLSHYLLDIGTEAGVYPMQRTIDGTASSTVVRDLIEGVTYEFRLTPIDVTGTSLPRLAAITRATAGASSASADPVPDDLLSPLHPGADLTPEPFVTPPPSIVESGISSAAMIMGMLVAVMLTFVAWYMRHEKHLTRRFLASIHHPPSS